MIALLYAKQQHKRNVRVRDNIMNGVTVGDVQPLGVDVLQPLAVRPLVVLPALPLRVLPLLSRASAANARGHDFLSKKCEPHTNKQIRT